MSINVSDSFETIAEEKDLFQCLNKLLIVGQEFKQYGFPIQDTHVEID